MMATPGRHIITNTKQQASISSCTLSHQIEKEGGVGSPPTIIRSTHFREGEWMKTRDFETCILLGQARKLQESRRLDHPLNSSGILSEGRLRI
jgi:hypothetical protein